MPCLVALLAIFFPRLVIVLLVMFNDWLGAAYETLLWPLAGFIFVPFTTLAYALAINQAGEVSGIYLLVLIVAVLMDIGSLSGGLAGRD